MAVEQRTLVKNQTLINAAERAKKSNGRFHFLGLVIIEIFTYFFYFFCFVLNENALLLLAFFSSTVSSSYNATLHLGYCFD